jgi:hypothetical protein
VYTGLNIPKGATGRLAKAQQTRAGLAAEAVEDLGETGKRSGGRGRNDRGGPRKDGARSSGPRSDRPRSDRPTGERSRTAPPGAKSTDSASTETPRAPRTDRQRRRTRGGGQKPAE